MPEGGRAVRQEARRRPVRLVASVAMVVVAAAGIALLSARPLSALKPGEEVLVAIYRRVAPAVVSLRKEDGQGSGFVIDPRGYIVTNNHVVSGARSVEVAFLDGTVLEGRVVGTDRDSDLAVVKVDELPPDVQPLQLGDSDTLQVGQQAIAVGNPFGLSGTMTAGIVSGLHRTIPASLSEFVIPDIIQTDASINPGNSGGPLVDSSGLVIGVTTAIRSTTGIFQGAGFAVPVSLVKRVVPALIERGRYDWPWLGVSGTTLTPQLAQANGLARQTRGAYVDRVIPGAPAERAGLRGTQRTVLTGGQRLPVGGDVIVAIDNTPVASFDDLLVYIARYTEVGKTVRVKVLRGGQTLELRAQLEARPAQVPDER